MTKNCDYGVKLPKNKLNLPTTKWNEDNARKIIAFCEHCGLNFTVWVSDSKNCPECENECLFFDTLKKDCPHNWIESSMNEEHCLDCGKILDNEERHKIWCNIPYFHDSNDMPCKRCHVGGRLSWWWKVIKSWYYKI